MNPPYRLLRCLLAGVTSLGCLVVQAQDDFDQPPISYRSATPDNTVSRLQSELDSGARSLRYDSDRGYLESVLEALNISHDSQMLVFSKTSLQVQRIRPQTPRAVYFNDDVYVGFCQSGDVLEISAADPQLGTVFYTLDQQQAVEPRFEQQFDNCLICHSSSRTKGVPGHLVRSLYVDAGGQPMFSAGSRTVNHTTPFEDRWGGWYVTGTHGKQSHLGNLVIHSRRVPEDVDNSQGQNVTDLAGRFDVDRYLTPHSDIVALMVLEHQTMVHNYLTKAAFATRQALHHQAAMNRALGYPEDRQLESTERRIQHAGDDLVEALLFTDEAPLSGPVRGTSGFAESFSATATRDDQGRSLRDLDLSKRLFRYPCSYLIDSQAFESLPQPMKDYVWRRLWEVLQGRDDSETFAHLTPDDRQAIREIIRDTMHDLPAYWR